MNKMPDKGTKQGFPENYPEEVIEDAWLIDETPVSIRPIRPDDTPRLQAGFSRLSPESVYLRFLESFSQLTDAQASEFTNVDYYNRMALVAEVEEDGEKNLIGVARYALIEPGVAECAVVVIDEYQGRGLGTVLLNRLVTYARKHGVVEFLATVHHTNSKVVRFVQRSGFPAERKMIEPGIWEIRLRLADDS
jgi:GNAT superfamily N-acetyltransferase